MAFLPNIPQPTDQLSISQGNILNNFTILGAIAGNTNASSASINATSGFNWIYLPPQGAIPPAGAAFTAGNIGLYSAANANSGQNELYINKQIAGPSTIQIPITAMANGTISASVATAWYYLSSGLKIISGQATTVGGTITITFASTALGGLNSFPGFSSFVTNITALRIDNSGSSSTVMRVKTISLTQATFGLANGSADSTFFWSVTGF